MQLNPYLVFNGNCADALKFYERSLGAKIEVSMPFAGTPAEAHVPAEARDKILHARFTVNGQTIMASDAFGPNYQRPQGISVALNTKDPAEAERVFQALSEKGKIGMPIQETFWATRFGMCVDQFGIPWMVNCEKAAMAA